MPDFLKGEAAAPADDLKQTRTSARRWARPGDSRNQGRREEAKALFTLILAKAPQNGAALNGGHGWLLLGGGEVDEAKGYFEKVLATEPLAGGAMNGLARVLKAQGDEAGAIKLWQEMVDKIPGHARRHLGAGRCLPGEAGICQGAAPFGAIGQSESWRRRHAKETSRGRGPEQPSNQPRRSFAKSCEYSCR